MKAIFAVMNTTPVVLKMRPKKNSYLYGSESNSIFFQ